NYELAQKQLEVSRIKATLDSLASLHTIKEVDADLLRMKRDPDMINERLENLHSNAPVEEQLASIAREMGQQTSSGTRMAQIHDLSDYKIETWMDEHYIDRITTLLRGSISKNDSTYELQIIKIFPEGKEGKFKVDM